MFHNNFGKCGPIFKILSPTDSLRKFSTYTTHRFPAHLQFVAPLRGILFDTQCIVFTQTFESGRVTSHITSRLSPFKQMYPVSHTWAYNKLHHRHTRQRVIRKCCSAMLSQHTGWRVLSGILSRSLQCFWQIPLRLPCYVPDIVWSKSLPSNITTLWLVHLKENSENSSHHTTQP